MARIIYTQRLSKTFKEGPGPRVPAVIKAQETEQSLSWAPEDLTRRGNWFQYLAQIQEKFLLYKYSICSLQLKSEVESEAGYKLLFKNITLPFN